MEPGMITILFYATTKAGREDEFYHLAAFGRASGVASSKRSRA